MTRRMLHAERRERRIWTTAAAPSCLLGHSQYCCSRCHVPFIPAGEEMDVGDCERQTPLLAADQMEMHVARARIIALQQDNFQKGGE